MATRAREITKALDAQEGTFPERAKRAADQWTSRFSALVIRALGLGLSLEALAEPGAVRSGLYGDFVTLLSNLLGENGAGARGAGAKPPERSRP